MFKREKSIPVKAPVPDNNACTHSESGTMSLTVILTYKKNKQKCFARNKGAYELDDTSSAYTLNGTTYYEPSHILRSTT